MTDNNKPIIRNFRLPFFQNCKPKKGDMLSTIILPNPTALSSGIDHNPLAEQLSNTSHSTTSSALTTSPLAHSGTNYQVTLGVVQGEKGVKHHLVLKENTIPASSSQEGESSLPAPKRRSSRVALRGRTRFSKDHSIIQKPQQQGERTTIIQKPRQQGERTTILAKKILVHNPEHVTLAPPVERHHSLQVRQEVREPSDRVIDNNSVSVNNSDNMPVQVSVSDKPQMAAGLSQADLDMTFDENEQKIVDATIEAFQTGTLTPLIKEELRCTIQSRRLAQGKGELKVEFKRPLKRKQVSGEHRNRSGWSQIGSD